MKTKSGWNGPSQAREGRSRLARGMADPSLFKNPKSKNRPCTKEVTAVVVYVRRSLVVLECGLNALAFISPQPSAGRLVLRTIINKVKVEYEVGLGSLVAATMGFVPNARITDVNGVVVITLVFVITGEVEAISFRCKSKDESTCRMLMNLPSLAASFEESKLVAGRQLSRQARVLRALGIALENSTGGVTGGHSSALELVGEGSMWKELDPANYPTYLPSLVLYQVQGAHDDQTGELVLEVHGLGSSSENDHFKRRIQEVKQVSNVQQNKRNGLREIEVSIDLDDEKAVVEMSESNRRRLLRKWGRLNVFSPADESDAELAGEIVDFEWREEDGCYVCVVRDKDNEDWPVGVSEIPKMVREADQADDVLLLYSESDDENEETETSTRLQNIDEESGEESSTDTESDESDADANDREPGIQEEASLSDGIQKPVTEPMRRYPTRRRT